MLKEIKVVKKEGRGDRLPVIFCLYRVVVHYISRTNAFIARYEHADYEYQGDQRENCFFHCFFPLVNYCGTAYSPFTSDSTEIKMQGYSFNPAVDK